MLNRTAVILKCKEPFIRWVNKSDSNGKNPDITQSDANEDKTVYLISDDDGENIDNWVRLNFKSLFEAELEDWYRDKNLWPKERDYKMFKDWFDVEWHSVIIDTVGEGIVDYGT